MENAKKTPCFYLGLTVFLLLWSTVGVITAYEGIKQFQETGLVSDPNLVVFVLALVVLITTLSGTEARLVLLYAVTVVAVISVAMIVAAGICSFAPAAICSLDWPLWHFVKERGLALFFAAIVNLYVLGVTVREEICTCD